MVKRLLAFLCAVFMLLCLSACGEKKILHCDHCGGEVAVDTDSNMQEDWIVYCADCNEELFGDDPILGTGE